MISQFLNQALCGAYSLDNSDLISSASLQEMVQSLNTSLVLRQGSNHNSIFATTGDICELDGNGIAIVIGSPTWEDQNLATTALNKGTATALASSYLADGINCLSKISGEYLIAIIDPEQDKCIVSVDRMGRYPLYYAILKNGIVFSSTASSVHANPEVPKSFSHQGLYNYVYFHMVPSPSSIYQSIFKLPLGSYLEINKGNICTNNHWMPSFKHSKSTTFQQRAIELRQHLQTAVASHFDKDVRIGAFLSGGLDSSTVAGMLSEISDTQAEAFSIGFSAKGYDEMPFARITAKHFGIKLHEYYVTPEDVVDALPKVATSYDEPFGNSSALPAYFCAKFAKESGVEKLLAGDGGDELFAGNERYSKQMVFEYYSKLPTWSRRSLIEPITATMPSKISLFRKMSSYINQANTPLPDRFQTYNFLHQHKPEEIFTKDFLSDVDSLLPLKYQRDIYNKPSGASTLDRMLYLDWQYTLADNDLRKVSHMCAMAGIEVSYPMLDDALVRFSCSVPDNWKMKRQKLRYFYKESLKGWLPDQTINKKKQGFGLPFGVWLRSHKPLQELAYDNLSKLKQRDYFNKSFIDQVHKLHRDGHASYYGELVWILTVLELWLQAHRP